MLEMYNRAFNFLRNHVWYGSLKESYMGMFYPGIVAVFLFRIVPSGNFDEWIWVVAGDLPLAYIASDDCQNPAAALDGYIGEMEEWINAAEEGRSVDDLIPINAPSTLNNAKALKSRMNFLDERILCNYKDDLNA
ncbi:MAG: hypothetical protein PHU14_03820 [Methylovulum sp.]|nr:hypothetical protein [Methylovulum sp.]